MAMGYMSMQYVQYNKSTVFICVKNLKEFKYFTAVANAFTRISRAHTSTAT